MSTSLTQLGASAGGRVVAESGACGDVAVRYKKLCRPMTRRLQVVQRASNEFFWIRGPDIGRVFGLVRYRDRLVCQQDSRKIRIVARDLKGEGIDRRRNDKSFPGSKCQRKA